MRIISGEFGGLRLKAVPGTKTRPTTDKIKENIFNIIGPYFDGGNVLDMYAGSGGLAIEAVSRGMEFATLIDRQFAAIQTINENVKTTKHPEKFDVIKGDTKKVVMGLTQKGRKYDLIFFDPPYAQQTIEDDIEVLFKNDLLSPDAMIVCETSSDVDLPESIESFKQQRTQQYGITNIVIYKGE